MPSVEIQAIENCQHTSQLYVQEHAGATCTVFMFVMNMSTSFEFVCVSPEHLVEFAGSHATAIISES